MPRASRLPLLRSKVTTAAGLAREMKAAFPKPPPVLMLELAGKLVRLELTAKGLRRVVIDGRVNVPFKRALASALRG